MKNISSNSWNTLFLLAFLIVGNGCKSFWYDNALMPEDGRTQYWVGQWKNGKQAGAIALEARHRHVEFFNKEVYLLTPHPWTGLSGKFMEIFDDNLKYDLFEQSHAYTKFFHRGQVHSARRVHQAFSWDHRILNHKKLSLKGKFVVPTTSWNNEFKWSFDLEFDLAFDQTMKTGDGNAAEDLALELEKNAVSNTEKKLMGKWLHRERFHTESDANGNGLIVNPVVAGGRKDENNSYHNPLALELNFKKEVVSEDEEYDKIEYGKLWRKFDGNETTPEEVVDFELAHNGNFLQILDPRKGEKKQQLIYRLTHDMLILHHIRKERVRLDLFQWGYIWHHYFDVYVRDHGQDQYKYQPEKKSKKLAGYWVTKDEAGKRSLISISRPRSENFLNYVVEYLTPSPFLGVMGQFDLTYLNRPRPVADSGHKFLKTWGKDWFNLHMTKWPRMFRKFRLLEKESKRLLTALNVLDYEMKLVEKAGENDELKLDVKLKNAIGPQVADTLINSISFVKISKDEADKLIQEEKKQRKEKLLRELVKMGSMKLEQLNSYEIYLNQKRAVSADTNSLAASLSQIQFVYSDNKKKYYLKATSSWDDGDPLNTDGVANLTRVLGIELDEFSTTVTIRDRGRPINLNVSALTQNNLWLRVHQADPADDRHYKLHFTNFITDMEDFSFDSDFSSDSGQKHSAILPHQ